MPLDDDAPQFFCAGLQGYIAEGPVIVLSFATPVPSSDQKTRAYRTNVRVAMTREAIAHMVGFLTREMSQSQQQGQTPPHPMPETKQ